MLGRDYREDATMAARRVPCCPGLSLEAVCDGGSLRGKHRSSLSPCLYRRISLDAHPQGLLAFTGLINRNPCFWDRLTEILEGFKRFARKIPQRRALAHGWAGACRGEYCESLRSIINAQRVSNNVAHAYNYKHDLR